MARPQPTRDRTVYQCVEPFAIFNKGIPEVYGADRMVLADDAILRTHGSHFRPVAERIEQMTASPGEFRPVDIPRPPEAQPVVTETATDPETEKESTDAQD